MAARVGEATRATGLRVPVLEAFASIQGEGAYAGDPQVFLRLSGCPLRCQWCDTPGSWDVPAVGDADADRLSNDAGERVHLRPRAWASALEVATWLAALDPPRRRAISVTGGEPLVWPDFVHELRTLVGAQRIHLETAGAHPQALASVLDVVDHVSLDLKLPADMDAPVPLDVATEGEPRSAADWAEVRARCLDLVRGRDACAKLIVAGGRKPSDFAVLLDDVASIAPELPVFIQPVTPVSRVAAPTRELLDDVVELALDRRLFVRVLPQLHRALRMP